LTKSAASHLTRRDRVSRGALTPRRFDVTTDNRNTRCEREEVMTMTLWRKGLTALAVTTALVGGYSAVAYAQTSDSSTSDSSTTQTQQGDSSQSTAPSDAAPAPAQGGGGSGNCPNM
jgi:hypothetical protein